jgi:hypothetical protein
MTGGNTFFFISLTSIIRALSQKQQELLMPARQQLNENKIQSEIAFMYFTSQ